MPRTKDPAKPGSDALDPAKSGSDVRVAVGIRHAIDRIDGNSISVTVWGLDACVLVEPRYPSSDLLLAWDQD